MSFERSLFYIKSQSNQLASKNGTNDITQWWVIPWLKFESSNGKIVKLNKEVKSEWLYLEWEIVKHQWRVEEEENWGCFIILNYGSSLFPKKNSASFLKCFWVSSNEVNEPRAYYTEWSKSEKNKYCILMHIYGI